MTSRTRDLECSIRESYEFIREYERAIQLASDPREKARSEENVKEQWTLIDGWSDEYTLLCREFGNNVPEDVAQIIRACKIWHACPQGTPTDETSVGASLIDEPESVYHAAEQESTFAPSVSDSQEPKVVSSRKEPPSVDSTVLSVSDSHEPEVVSPNEEVLSADSVVAVSGEAEDVHSIVYKRLPLVIPPDIPKPVTPETIGREYVDHMKPIPPNSADFYMASCLVSNALYHCFVQANAYWHPVEGECTARKDVDNTYLRHWVDGRPKDKENNLPVIYVSFRAAEAFADWLSALTGHNVSLPKLGEWQMAVRADRAHWFEEELDDRRVNYYDTSNRLHVIDAFKENPWHIHDLLGNAYDMCVTLDTTPVTRWRVGGCYHSPRGELKKQHKVKSGTECPPATSFRCVCSPEPDEVNST
jgi:hypothetical protein